jgi:hypothetical protein
MKYFKRGVVEMMRRTFFNWVRATAKYLKGSIQSQASRLVDHKRDIGTATEI